MNERLKKLQAQLDEQMERNAQLQATAENSELSESAQAEARDAWVKGLDAVDALQANIDNESRALEHVRRRESRDDEQRETAGAEDRSGSFGERVVRSLRPGLEKVKRGIDRYSVASEEVRAETVTTGLTNYDQGGVVQLPLERPTIASVLLSGTISGNGYTYFVEGAVTDGSARVAEAGEKPEVSGQFTQTSEALGKVAAWTKESDELVEDFPLLRSVVEGRLIRRLVLREEAQILNGNGSTPNLSGLLNRSGVQTITQTTESTADAIFNAMTKVQTATFLSADFIVINPADYETLRLAKDGNGQYYGGGFFQGQYGNGGVGAMPGLWGLNTVVTSAIAAGTILVGSGQAAQVFRKGGVRVDVANQNEDDFIHDLVTVRAEIRQLLAVYMPAAFVKITLAEPDEEE